MAAHSPMVAILLLAVVILAVQFDSAHGRRNYDECKTDRDCPKDQQCENISKSWIKHMTCFPSIEYPIIVPDYSNCKGFRSSTYDAWCKANCNHDPIYCPKSLCVCGNKGLPTVTTSNPVLTKGPTLSFDKGTVIIVSEYDCDHEPVVTWTRNLIAVVLGGRYLKIVTHHGNHYIVRLTISDLRMEDVGNFVQIVGTSQKTLYSKSVLTLTATMVTELHKAFLRYNSSQSLANGNKMDYSNCRGFRTSTYDAWCKANCNHDPIYCPKNLCVCGNKERLDRVVTAITSGSCDTKSWPSVVGMSFEEAKATILLDCSYLKVYKMLPGSAWTHDLRSNRVRVSTDAGGVVVRTPNIA